MKVKITATVSGQEVVATVESADEQLVTLIRGLIASALTSQQTALTSLKITVE